MNETKCRSCQIDAKRDAGEEVTGPEASYWMMWGCTCTPESVDAAQAYMGRVAR